MTSSELIFNTIQGELTYVYLEKSEDQEIIIDIEGIKQEKTNLIYMENFCLKQTYNSMTNQLGFQYICEKFFLTSSEHKIFPIKIDDGQSALVLQINSQSLKNNLKKFSIDCGSISRYVLQLI